MTTITFADAINKVVANPRYNATSFVVSRLEETILENIKYLVDNFSNEIINNIKKAGCCDTAQHEQGKPEEVIFEGGIIDGLAANAAITYSFKRKSCNMVLLATAPKIQVINQGLTDKEQETIKTQLRAIEFPFKVGSLALDRPNNEWVISTNFRVQRIEFLSDKSSNLGRAVRVIYVELEEV